MSFTTNVKSEIINVSFPDLEQKEYILKGLLSANLKIFEDRFELTGKNEEVNNFLNSLYIDVYNKDIHKCTKEEFSNLFRNFDEHKYMIPNIKLSNYNLLKCFLIGVYLGAGSLTDPETRYHLEMRTGSEKLSYFVINILDKFDIKAKINVRKANYYVYIKEAEHISDFLKLCGATHALLQFEDLRVVKDVRNTINRKVNCELANLNKVILTGVKQQEDILLVKEKMGLQSLPKKLYDVAIIRLEDEQLSFNEIGEMLTPKISKSTVCKRLGKISEIAEELRGVQLC